MKKVLIILCLLTLSFSGCSVYKSLSNLARLKFKISHVGAFSLNGVMISSKRSITDFSVSEIASITSAVSRGSLNASFTIFVNALNPNDGKGGYPRTDASIKSFPFRLFLNDVETISGNIGSGFNIPGTGEIATIPFQISMDLMSFFRNQTYQSLVNLALGLGGASASSANVKLVARPVIGTKLGNISYPNDITIINAEFR